MTLPPATEWAVSEALADVQKAARELSAVHDTDAAKRALQAVRRRVLTAYDQINTAEREAREAALANLGIIA